MSKSEIWNFTSSEALRLFNCRTDAFTSDGEKMWYFNEEERLCITEEKYSSEMDHIAEGNSLGENCKQS